jgi:YHS domain-containing protein
MKQLVLIICALLGMIVNSNGQEAAKRQKEYNVSKNVAIDGYDPVSYFNGKPKKGSSKLAYTADGIIYYFSTTEDLAKFKQSPSAYEPQYGGWCAYAMGNTGEKVEVDPETYKIIDGKLYLYYNKYFTNTLKSWNKNEARLKTNADANWQKIYH